MSTETKSDDAAPGSRSAPSAPKGLLQSPKMLIALVVIVVMAVEGAVLLVMLKPGAPAADPAAGETGTVEEEGVPAVPGSEQLEVEIGNFNCSNNLAAPGSVLHISFKLAVTVPASEESNFEKAKNANKHRIQEAVIIVLRRSLLEDLNEPELGTVKRRLQESINKVLGKSYVKDIVITDIRMMEQ
ncbi:MAG: flagellar basal body-associated FliL family protein [Planctomycetaceae bacterium]